MYLPYLGVWFQCMEETQSDLSLIHHWEVKENTPVPKSELPKSQKFTLKDNSLGNHDSVRVLAFLWYEINMLGTLLLLSFMAPSAQGFVSSFPALWFKLLTLNCYKPTATVFYLRNRPSAFRSNLPETVIIGRVNHLG